MAQVSQTSSAEVTLLGVESQLRGSEPLEYFGQVLQVFLEGPASHDDVVEIDQRVGL